MGRPLEGLLVLALEQAVAAPYCSSRLADAGARVIKVERPEGDFARRYDRAVGDLSSYFVWLNRGSRASSPISKRRRTPPCCIGSWPGRTCSSRTWRLVRRNGLASGQPRSGRRTNA